MELVHLVSAHFFKIYNVTDSKEEVSKAGSSCELATAPTKPKTKPASVTYIGLCIQEEENSEGQPPIKPQLEQSDSISDHLGSSTQHGGMAKTTYVAPSFVFFWLGMWFMQNVGVTFWNKKALTAIRLPVTLTFVHMICNSIGAFIFIHVYRGIHRKPLKRSQQWLMLNFSLIFVSNIIFGNWSLGLVSISFNQIMRALVPSVVVGLSIVILGKTYSYKRKAALLPVACGVYLACTGDNSCTFLGFLITLAAVLFAGLKAVLSSKFLTGDLKLHPVDLILHQAPLSALWCLLAIQLTEEKNVLYERRHELPALSVWYIITGIISFLLNITSFYANQVTSPVTLCVCGNVKQVFVITLSLILSNEPISIRKMIGIGIVTLGGAMYAYISAKEMAHSSSAPIKYESVKKVVK
ncbi:unnamed protein product [Albugo candida]|uniref:Sugar phosphate transporter domain-containing protein n=1 Tax=Albugo candida TaxID=65357 RepID=A0A024FYT9_9STRA|nr:unnamed protein product [Albugo candida]|eukprot:CCI39582.1 unnamed protein product [Albugo candida]